jgi:hypothetical protein
MWESRYVYQVDKVWFKHSSSISFGRLIMIIDEHWRSDSCVVAIRGCVDVGWHGLTIFLFKEVETKRSQRCICLISAILLGD